MTAPDDVPTDGTTARPIDVPIDVPTDRSGTYFCVVDSHPRFQLEVLRWYASLTRLCGVAPEDLLVCEVDYGAGARSPATRYLEAHGVAVERIAPYDARSPHCNKITAARAAAALGRPGPIVLCDTDLAILRDARSISVSGRAVGGKIVDAENPALAVIRHVFSEADVPFPPVATPEFAPDGATASTNLNAGLIVFPEEPGEILDSWDRWAKWLLDNMATFGAWMAPDQVSMALAMVDDDIALVPVNASWNFPTGPISTWDPALGSPAVLHYHANVDALGFLTHKGVAAVDRCIDAVNGAVLATWRDAAPVVAQALARVAAERTRKRVAGVLNPRRRGAA